MVVGTFRKKELLKQIEDETGVKPREKEIMKYYSKYLAEMVNSLTETEVEEASEMAMQWNKMGVPLKFKLTQPNRKVGRFSDTWPVRCSKRLECGCSCCWLEKVRKGN